MRYFKLILLAVFSFVACISYGSENLLSPEIMKGQWIGGQYVRDKSDKKSEAEVYPIIMNIEEVGPDGQLYGTYKQFKPQFEEMVKDDIISGYIVNFNTGEIIVKGEDKQEEGRIYGDSKGIVDINDKVSFRLNFEPYEKYRNHPFLERNEVWFYYEKK